MSEILGKIPATSHFDKIAGVNSGRFVIAITSIGSKLRLATLMTMVTPQTLANSM